jgi:pimeloyl-ACP methyl ester carboxylesterase
MSSPLTESSETVVLVHGIASVPLSMAYIKGGLEKEGYDVLNLGYQSTRSTVENAASELHARVVSAVNGGKIHFVAHSMGNIVVRKMLAEPLSNLGRMVMITPPNQGSELSERFKNLELYKWVFGPAGQQLSSDNSAFFNSLPVPPCQFGIIAGGKGNDRGFNPLLKGDNDGTISVETTRMEGASDFSIIDSLHTMILFSRETLGQVVSFLKSGKFRH